MSFIAHPPEQAAWWQRGALMRISFSGLRPSRVEWMLSGAGESHHIAGAAFNDVAESRRPRIQCRSLFCRALIVVVMSASHIRADMVQDRTNVLRRNTPLRQ